MAEAILLVPALPAAHTADNFTDKWIGAVGRDDHLITLPLDLTPIGINHILNIGDNLPQIFTLANARAAPIPLVDQFSIRLEEELGIIPQVIGFGKLYLQGVLFSGDLIFYNT